jgi:hypothetical protein
MNHASLLALLAATAFLMPLLTQVAESVGISRGLSMLLTVGAAGLIGISLLARHHRSSTDPSNTSEPFERMNTPDLPTHSEKGTTLLEENSQLEPGFVAAIPSEEEGNARI